MQSIQYKFYTLHILQIIETCHYNSQSIRAHKSLQFAQNIFLLRLFSMRLHKQILLSARAANRLHQPTPSSATHFPTLLFIPTPPAAVVSNCARRRQMKTGALAQTGRRSNTALLVYTPIYYIVYIIYSMSGIQLAKQPNRYHIATTANDAVT